MKKTKNTGTALKRMLLILLSAVFVMQTFVISAGAKYGIGSDKVLTNDYNGYVFHIKSYYGKYLDVKSAKTADGSYVWAYDFNINAACQEWRIIKCGTDGGDPIYHIQDVNSGKLLSIPGSFSYAVNVWIWHDDGTDGQIFKIKKNSDGTYSFFSKCSGYKKALSACSSFGRAYANVYNVEYKDWNPYFKWTIEFASQNRYDNGAGVCDGSYLFNNYGDDDNGLVSAGPCMDPYHALIWMKKDNVTVKKVVRYYLFGFIPIYRYIQKSVLTSRNYGSVIDNNNYGAINYKIKYEGKGYYSIAYGYNQYLTYDSTICDFVIIESGDVGDNQLWKIERVSTESGQYEYYTFTPKTNSSYKMYSDGCNIHVSNQTDDTTKWRLLCEESSEVHDCLLISPQCFEGDAEKLNSAWIGTAQVALCDAGLNSFKTYYEDGVISINELKKKVVSSAFVSIVGHGSGTSTSIYTEQRVNNKSESESICLKSNDGFSNWDLSEVEFIMFNGCCTAANWKKSNSDGLDNLLTVACSDGATWAVGFDISVTQQDLPRFLMAFYYYLEQYALTHDMDTEEERLDGYANSIYKALDDAHYVDHTVRGHIVLLKGWDKENEKWNYECID